MTSADAALSAADAERAPVSLHSATRSASDASRAPNVTSWPARRQARPRPPPMFPLPMIEIFTRASVHSGMRVDHLVIWVDDPARTVEWFQRVVGLEPVRVAEYAAKQVAFPSVRVCDDTIIDVMPRAMAEAVNAIPGAKGTAGHPTNHICFAMSEAEYHALARRLEESGRPGGRFMENQFGARGLAPKAFYFRDL